ncbi:hypothetical protein [Desulfarculus baarsii]
MNGRKSLGPLVLAMALLTALCAMTGVALADGRGGGVELALPPAQDDPLAQLDATEVLADMQDNKPWRACLLGRWQQTRDRAISLQPRLEGSYEKRAENWQFWASAYLQYEAADVSEDGWRADIDQLYWQAQHRQLAMTLGKRVVTWGSADGLRALDLLNPVDLSNPLKEGSRSSNKKAVWMAQAAWQPEHWMFEVSFLPEPAVTSLPGDTSPWFTFFQEQLAQGGLPARIEDPAHDPELGLRVCHFSHWLDLELIYFHGYQDSPLMLGADQSEIRIGYRKSDVLGLAVQSAMHQSTWRWELNYGPNYVIGDASGVERTARVLSLLGWDYRFNNGVSLNLQGYGQYLDQGARADDFGDYGLSAALAKDDLWGGDLALTYGVVWQISDASSFHQLAATWFYSDQLQLKASINVFTGPHDSTYGQYADDSLLMFSFKHEL